MENAILRLPEVCRTVGLSPTTLWRLQKTGGFPQRRKLSTNTVGWLRSEVDAWISSRTAGGRQA